MIFVMSLTQILKVLVYYGASKTFNTRHPYSTDISRKGVNNN